MDDDVKRIRIAVGCRRVVLPPLLRVRVHLTGRSRSSSYGLSFIFGLLKLSGRTVLRARYATLASLKHNDTILDQVLLVSMPGPNSFTGEDVVEISCHGNLNCPAIIEACVESKSCTARPGEFTRRALENGKMTLLQAEALNGVIHARSLEGLKLVHNNLGGELDKVSHPLEKNLIFAQNLRRCSIIQMMIGACSVMKK